MGLGLVLQTYSCWIVMQALHLISVVSGMRLEGMKQLSKCVE